MTLKLIAPILKKISSPSSHTSGEKLPLLSATRAPSVQVTTEAEDLYNQDLRAEMKKKVWESGGSVSTFPSNYFFS